MKKVSVVSVAVILMLVLSSCSMHLGLHKLLGSSNATPTKTKHIKATHTPPSPPSTNATPGAVLTPAANTVMITNAGYQPNHLQVKVGTTSMFTSHSNGESGFTKTGVVTQ